MLGTSENSNHNHHPDHHRSHGHDHGHRITARPPPLFFLDDVDEEGSAFNDNDNDNEEDDIDGDGGDDISHSLKSVCICPSSFLRCPSWLA